MKNCQELLVLMTQKSALKKTKSKVPLCLTICSPRYLTLISC